MTMQDIDGPYYCPHGEEVETPGGACYWCAQEDADGSDTWPAGSYGFMGPGYD